MTRPRSLLTGFDKLVKARYVSSHDGGVLVVAVGISSYDIVKWPKGWRGRKMAQTRQGKRVCGLWKLTLVGLYNQSGFELASHIPVTWRVCY